MPRRAERRISIEAPSAKSIGASVRDCSTWLQKSALTAVASHSMAVFVGLADR